MSDVKLSVGGGVAGYGRFAIRNWFRTVPIVAEDEFSIVGEISLLNQQQGIPAA